MTNRNTVTMPGNMYTSAVSILHTFVTLTAERTFHPSSIVSKSN